MRVIGARTAAVRTAAVRTAAVATVCLLCLAGLWNPWSPWAPEAEAAEIERYAVIIGNNAGDSDEPLLRYAEDDADKVYDVLKNMGGFGPENMLLLRGERADTVRLGLISMNERIRAASAPGRPRSMLFVYYSGHADAKSLHLDGSNLPLREVEKLVQGSAAAFRVLVLDACRSGALTQVKGQIKGGRRGPPLLVKLEQTLASEGTVFLTASSANEDAQESERIKGSFFTHYLVSGLMGAADSNSDGRIVLEEAYRYAYDHTLRASSRTLSGTQHPTFRYDLRGQGQIPLTSVIPEGRRAIVNVPAGRSYLLFRGDSQGPVVAEVGSRDRVRRISIKTGRYFVRARAQRFLLEGSLSFEGGREYTIDEDALDRIDYARFVRKGLAPVSVVHGLQAGLSGRSGVFSMDACLGPYLGYSIEARHVTVVPRLGFCGRSEVAATDGQPPAPAREWSAELRLIRAFDIAPVTVGLGVVPGLSMIADGSTTPGGGLGRYRTAASLGTTLGAALELWGSSYASLDIDVQTYLQRQHVAIYDGSAPAGAPPREIRQEWDAGFAVRLGAGIGMRW